MRAKEFRSSAAVAFKSDNCVVRRNGVNSSSGSRAFDAVIRCMLYDLLPLEISLAIGKQSQYRPWQIHSVWFVWDRL